jgi:hypothetical protein
LTSVKALSLEQRALAAARAVATDRGVSCDRAAVVYSGSNVLVHLRPAPVVARVMTGTVVLHADPRRWLEREVSVLRFLASSGLAVAPSSLIAPGPYKQDELWMTCWEWVAHQRQTELAVDAENLGRALRDLHRELSGFAGDLGDLLDVQEDIERLHRQLRPIATLSADTRDSLRRRLYALGNTVFASPLPTQALHGDASLTNLLRTPDGLIWNDFEDVCRGPVHWDVAGFLISLRARGADSAFIARALDAYGGLDEQELAPFAEAHDLYGELWRLYDVQRRW